MQVNLPPNFRQLARQMGEERGEQAVMAVALDGERFTKQSFGRSPSPPYGPPGVDSGNLRSQVQAQDGGHRLHKVLVSGAEYSIYLEFGTVRMAPRPFMRPALWYMSQNAMGIIERLW